MNKNIKTNESITFLNKIIKKINFMWHRITTIYMNEATLFIETNQ